MRKITTTLAIMLAAVTLAPTASAQDLLAGKPIFPLGEAKTWTAGETTYTFVTADLEKLVATPTNTANVYLFPEEGGGWNTEANKNIGIQGFYIDMESKQGVGTVTTTWEGAAANSYDIYLTDTEPTLDILNTTPTYQATGLGQYTSNTAILPEGAEGRYLVFQPTDATNWGWGVKIRSISATAPVEAKLTSFSVTPGFAILNEATPVTFTFKDQLGIDIPAEKVNVTVSDNATYADGKLTIASGTVATFTATMGEIVLTANVYAPTAPEVPADASIKTPIFTNGVTEYNSTAGWTTDYNGGAKNNGTITFPNGEVAQSFGNTQCVFFYNSETTGAWNGSINPTEKGYRSLHLDIFGTKDCNGSIEFEGTSGVIEHTQNFTLEAGKWNPIDVILTGETQLNNMSVRFDAANMCDILLANIYFTPAYVEGDEEAPVLGEVTATPAMTSVTLSFSATDDKSADIYYIISDGTKSYSTSGKSGETVEYTVTGLAPSTEYTFTVTASDGKNVSDPKTVKATTTGMPDAPTPTVDAQNVVAIYSPHYNATSVPAFDTWGSTASATTTATNNGETILNFSNYDGQWGGLVNLDTDISELENVYLHIDIYSDTNGSLTVAPVWAEANGDTPDKKLTIEGGKWNSYNIDATDFGYPEHGNKIIQFAMTNSTLPAFAVNNLYFYGDKRTGVEEIATEAAAVVDVFNMQGVRVRHNVSRAEATLDLAPGIYIIGGKKVLVK